MKRKAWLLLCSLLCGCDQPAPQSYAGLGQPAGGFSQVSRGHRLEFPRDHAAHDGFRIEWWYVTANLKDTKGVTGARSGRCSARPCAPARRPAIGRARTCGWATRVDRPRRPSVS